MRSKPYFDPLRITAACVISTLLACGGGSGGNGGGGGGGGHEGDSAYGVRVLHAAIDGAPVDVTSSTASSPILSKQVFAGTKGYRGLAGGAQILSLTRAQTPSDVIDSFSVEGAPDDRYTILLYGDNATFGLRARLFQDEIPDTQGGAALRVINGVTQAANVTISIGTDPTQTIAFGDATEYVATKGGAVNVSAVRATDGSPIQSGPITLEIGKAYTLLLAGEIGYYTKSVLFTDAN